MQIHRFRMSFVLFLAASISFGCGAQPGVNVNLANSGTGNSNTVSNTAPSNSANNSTTGSTVVGAKEPEAYQATVTLKLEAVGGQQNVALPTLVASPPPLSDYAGFPLTRLTRPFNLAGVPALAMPVPSPGYPVPVSLQLVGPMSADAQATVQLA